MIIQEAMVTLGLLINSVYSIPTDYWRTRMQLLRLEEIESFGGDIALDVAERTANNYLMLAKNSEINSGQLYLSIKKLENSTINFALALVD